ncbi:MAG: serine hydroxymethyltransferase [Erysipelotrichaceae bacterium]|nr:serine hydroxymethyltransferase [Erysipelotrichaceae bacterium]MCB9499832.1 serine hydroxymethyltransferase [Erysipelotrichaceae bacterium]
MDYIKNQDSKVFEAIEKEKYRQQTNIELIASENFVSNAVLETIGCVMTNKYAEGYPGARYYGGCENVDVVEVLAQERIKKLFNVKYANVQPHSGSQANMAVYKALLNHGDKVLGMSLSAGGHLTHGYKLSFSGQDYECHSYGLNKETEQLDYDDIEKIAMEIKPKMIIAGASAYSRFIDFKRFSQIAKKVGAYLFVDMAHIAGLVATGLHQNPCDYADVVTSTTHKTLRGPRGGIILTNNLEIYKKINKAVFPGIQGGPLMNIIAAKAVAFKEDLDPSFHIYAERVIKNAKAFAGEFEKLGYRIVSGGTDNHLFMIDIFNSIGVTGLEAETLLHSVNITVNKNTIPNETLSANITSGIRLGTPAMTTRGFTEEDFKKVAHLIDAKLKKTLNDEEIKKEVKQLTDKYPLWY